MVKRFLFNSFNFVLTVDRWVRRHFTPAGLIILSGLLASAVIGLDTNRSTAYQVFTFLLIVLIISMLWGNIFRTRFSGLRRLPPFATAGERFTYRVVIENLTQRTHQNLYYFEQPLEIRPSFEEFLKASANDDRDLNFFDRKIGYYRWIRLVYKKQRAKTESQAVPKVLPNGRTEFVASLLPLKRGHLRLKGFTIARMDPLGLFKSFVNVALPESVIILPKRYPLPPIQLPGTRTYQPGGISLASSVGDSEEFMSLRDYRTGDPLRQIHWKSWAKTGKPVVKENQDEFFVRHALILDTFLKDEFSDILEEAVSIAASFVCSIQTQDALLDLMFTGPKTYLFTSGRGLAHEEQILKILASVTACTNKPFSTLFSLVLEQAPFLSSCICIFISWDRERQKLVESLKGFGLSVLVLVVMDSENSIALDPGPMRDDSQNLHKLQVGKIKEGLAGL